MHASTLGFVAGGGLTRADIAAKDVLDVGSGDWDMLNLRGIVEAFKPASYVGVDMREGPNVDRLVAAENVAAEFGPDSFDVVICTELLEFVDNWQQVWANLLAVLRPGGVLLIATRRPGSPPQMPDPGSEGPLGNWRFTVEAMVEIARLSSLDPKMVCTDPDPTYVGLWARLVKPLGWEAPLPLPMEVDGVTAAIRPLSILGLPHGVDGSTYYRYFLPYSLLQRLSGHRVMVPQPGTTYLPHPRELAEVDVLTMQRPSGPKGMECWAAWKPHVKLVYECDDDVLRVDPSGLPHLHDDKMRDTIKFCLQLSDMVTVSTPYLAEQFAKYCERVVVLPNYFDGELLNHERPRRDRLTVGWAGGSSHLADWASIAAPAVKAVLDDEPDVDMHFMGVDFSPMLGHIRERCRFTPWAMDVPSYQRTVDFDIGLAPLADSDFNNSKSDIRAKEMAALGIPIVASDSEPYRHFVIDGVTGFLVRTEDEWKARLTELINDADCREEMGRKAREHASGYAAQDHWREWARAYEELTGWKGEQA